MNENGNGQNGPVLSVRGFVRNKDGKILIIKRGPDAHAPGRWCLPGGLVNYKESPEEAVTKLVKEKTNLDYGNLSFLWHQNSPPDADGNRHCLNMYYKGDGQGDIKLKNATEYRWATAEEANSYNLAFNAEAALPVFEAGNVPYLEKITMLMDEAGRAGIPTTIDTLKKINAYPGFFTQMKADLEIYELVTTKIYATLEMTQKQHKRNHDNIISQIEARTKEPRSALEKMVRKATNGTPRHYTTFDDMAAGRAVVSFLSDIDLVVEHFQNNPEYKVLNVDDRIRTPMATGYRGVHLRMEVPIIGAHFMPKCELQVRTNYQHAWAISAHELTYKNDKIPDRYLTDLLALSDTLADADRISDRIRNKLEEA